VTALIRSGGADINKREIEAELTYAFIDLPINLKIKWLKI
jgi:hypothetical protein